MILHTSSLSPFAQIAIGTGGIVALVHREGDTPVKKPNLEQLMNERRPLLFSRMPRMLRRDGTMAGALQHRFRYFEDIQTHPAPVSAHRWRLALQTSRILSGQRRRANHAR